MLTPQEVSTHSFTKAMMGGYNMAMVDEFLDTLTDDYSALYKENAGLKAKLKVLVEKVEDYRATEDSMRATLLTAQKMADSIVKEAEAKRQEMLSHTEDEISQRRQELQNEVAELEERLRQGQLELARFIAASRELCSRQVTFLDNLPQLEISLPQTAAPEEEPAGEIQQSVEAAFAPEAEPEAEPAQEEEVAGAMEEEPIENPFAAEAEVSEPTRRINLDDLKFGRNYNNHG